MNKNVPERGMSKARWEQLRGTTNGGMGRTLRQRARFVHISQQYTPIVEEVKGEDGETVIARNIVGWDPAYKMGKQPKGRTYVKPKEEAAS